MQKVFCYGLVRRVMDRIYSLYSIQTITSSPHKIANQMSVCLCVCVCVCVTCIVLTHKDTVRDVFI